MSLSSLKISDYFNVFDSASVGSPFQHRLTNKSLKGPSANVVLSKPMG